MELHLSGAPSRKAVGSTVCMEETVDQRDEPDPWTGEALPEERRSLKEEAVEEVEEEEVCRYFYTVFLDCCMICDLQTL